MDSGALLDAFRSEVADTEAPFLWDDDEALTYLDDAQKMFCRLTGGIGDASSSVTQLTSSTDTDWLALSPLILKIRDITRVATGREVEVVNFEDMRRHGWRFDGVPGPVRRIVIGMEPGRVRLHPYPDQAETFQMIVDRLPLRRISDVNQKLEIAEQHHAALLWWMKARAYGKQDAETYDRTKSAECEQRFRLVCDDAKAEKDRAMHKTRVVSYGGI